MMAPDWKSIGRGKLFVRTSNPKQPFFITPEGEIKQLITNDSTRYKIKNSEGIFDYDAKEIIKVQIKEEGGGRDD